MHFFSLLLQTPGSILAWLTYAAVAVASALWQLHRCRKHLSSMSLAALWGPDGQGRAYSFGVDFLINIIHRLTFGLMTALMFAVTTGVSVLGTSLLGLAFHSHAQCRMGYFAFLACGMICFLTGDFSYYLTHYLQHKVPALWELHKVHHSATFLTPLTTKRKHPLSEMLDQFVGSALLGIPISFFAFFCGLTVLDQLTIVTDVEIIGSIVVLDAIKHSSFTISFGRLDGLFISPHMHQLHHSEAKRHWNKNFGSKLSVWDHVFGTSMIPALGEKIIYGLGKEENERFQDILYVFLHPFTAFVSRSAGAAADLFKGGRTKVQGSEPQRLPPTPLRHMRGTGERHRLTRAPGLVGTDRGGILRRWTGALTPSAGWRRS